MSAGVAFCTPVIKVASHESSLVPVKRGCEGTASDSLRPRRRRPGEIPEAGWAMTRGAAEVGGGYNRGRASASTRTGRAAIPGKTHLLIWNERCCHLTGP